MTYVFFSNHELSCRHCGLNHMNDAFMQKLVRMRTELDFPFPLSSAYRCPTYNNTVSSTGFNGPHTTGRAVDIMVSGKQAFDIVSRAAEFGFTGIGVKQKGANRFIHLDDLDIDLRPWIWSY